MRPNRLLRQMAGIEETPAQKSMRRAQRALERRQRVIEAENALVAMISRREQGQEGTPPMPFAAMRADLAKAKGQK